MVDQLLSRFKVARVSELFNVMDLTNLEDELADRLDIEEDAARTGEMLTKVLSAVAEYLVWETSVGPLPWKTISVDVGSVITNLDRLENSIDESGEWAGRFLFGGDLDIKKSLAALRENSEGVIEYCSGRDGRGRPRKDLLRNTVDRLLDIFLHYGGREVLDTLDGLALSDWENISQSHSALVFEFIQIPLKACGIAFSENEIKRYVGHKVPLMRGDSGELASED